MDRQLLFVILVVIPVALIVVPIALAWRKELKRRATPSSSRVTSPNGDAREH